MTFFIISECIGNSCCCVDPSDKKIAKKQMDGIIHSCLMSLSTTPLVGSNAVALKEIGQINNNAI